MAFRRLAAGNFPQHRTLCEFRRRHLEEFGRLFVEVVGVAREMGVVRFGTLSVDGTKVRANASKRKAMSHERMLKEEARLKEELKALMARAGAVDPPRRLASAMARRCAATSYPRSCNAERSDWRRLRKRKSVWRRRNAQPIDARRAQARPGAQSQGGGAAVQARLWRARPEGAEQLHRPREQRIMKTSTEGFQQCYNAQLAVDGEHQIIVEDRCRGAGRRPGPDDGRCSTRCIHRFGAEPEVVLADAGYCNEADLVELEERGIDGRCGAGPGGQDAGGARPAHETRELHRMSEKLAAPQGSRAIRQAQVVIGGAERLDQGGARVQTVQPSGPGQGTG